MSSMIALLLSLADPAYAQVVEQSEKLVDRLLKEGWAGIVVIILIIQIGYLIKLIMDTRKEIREVNESRVKDSQESRDKMIEVFVSVQNALNTLTELVKALGGDRRR